MQCLAPTISVFEIGFFVIVEVVRDAALTSPSWGALQTGSILEVDTSATIDETGTVLVSVIHEATAEHDLADVFNFLAETIRRNAVITGVSTYTIRARLLVAGTTALRFHCFLSWTLMNKDRFPWLMK